VESKLKKSTDIAKPSVQGVKTWTVETDEAITRTIADGSSYANFASESGNGLKRSDINNRWNRYLKKLIGIIKLPIQAG
jgi:hypothetical protein